MEHEKKKNIKKSSYRRKALERFMDHKPALFGALLCAVEVAMVILAPMIFKMDPYSVDAQAFGTPIGVNGHILGTDTIGRDILARLCYGGRVSLFVGFFSTVVSMVIGIPLGLLAGYARGAVEAVIMRATDIAMSFPAIILILVAVSIVGPSMWSVTLIIGILGWTQFARITYSKVLSVSQMEYVEAARAIGESGGAIMMRYIFPNILPPLLIAMTFSIANAILTESALSFIGMGVQPPMASWGNMIYDAKSIAILAGKQWMWIPAGSAILLTVLSINFLGDGIRDALDPKINI